MDDTTGKEQLLDFTPSDEDVFKCRGTLIRLENILKKAGFKTAIVQEGKLLLSIRPLSSSNKNGSFGKIEFASATEAADWFLKNLKVSVEPSDESNSFHWVLSMSPRGPQDNSKILEMLSQRLSQYIFD